MRRTVSLPDLNTSPDAKRPPKTVSSALLSTDSHLQKGRGGLKRRVTFNVPVDTPGRRDSLSMQELLPRMQAPSHEDVFSEDTDCLGEDDIFSTAQVRTRLALDWTD